MLKIKIKQTNEKVKLTLMIIFLIAIKKVTILCFLSLIEEMEISIKVLSQSKNKNLLSSIVTIYCQSSFYFLHSVCNNKTENQK